MVTAEAKVVAREGRTLKGQATLYDEEQRVVMEFMSTFKMAADTRIKGIVFADDGPE